MPYKTLYKTGHLFIRLYAYLMLELDIRWREPLPSGAKLFAANHPSATDPFLIHLVSSQPVSTMITQNAFDVPLLGRYLQAIGQISVVPGKGRVALDKAHQMLTTGNPVAIFPEGLFSPSAGGSHPPRTGAARLALSTGAPVIPVGISLLRERMHVISSGISGKKTVGYWYFRGPYCVTVGQPLQFNGDPEDRDQVARVSSTIMEHISSLALESEKRLPKPTLPVAAQ